MMSLLVKATLALGLFANAAVAGGYTNAGLTTTETQEIGSTTSDGAIWYSMNVCEIVQQTQCDVSLSHGGAAPPGETNSNGAYPPPSEPKPSVPVSSKPQYNPPPASEEPAPTEGGDQPPPTEGQPPAPTESAEQPPPTVLTTTNAAGKETTVPATLVPATTNSDGSVVPSGSTTEEPTGQSTTAGALTLGPAVASVLACGALAVLLNGI